MLYATGLRVSELISLKLANLHLDEGYLTCVGKGDKERIVPIGQDATDWVRRYIAEARPRLAARSSPWLFVNARGGAAVARRILEAAEGVRHEGRDHRGTSARTCCGIPSRRICSTAARISGRSR